ncbi:hypothetical protein DFR24_2672 [Panacagrimonas perspica]|uniref:Uncharacterized protein n=1 Tax=Panacagrimonas perspica TaxID=381431 RepID=A0A4R7P3H4_9GAMM|nr:hypothetical protein [Panacagrimonas perspica]TDU28304.1 hypothetical protein DFR24_2672 [Panacagrimonas perspica]THD02467.1 hypothetical protein B1810_14620 [Panacagrimonas perspica]
MNSWTDIGLIIAIVIGLISAASLPMVSVNAVSPESLRMTQVSNEEPSPWALVSEGEVDNWAVPAALHADSTAGAATDAIGKLDPRQASASAR